MLGYDMSWASFHVIEVMSSAKFTHKRIGYIAAATSFRQDTDVLMLCTNLIKKDLSSNNYLETALALNGLATIVTPDLGRDLAPDLLAMLNHSRPYIRKRVVLVLYKTLRVAFPRLKDKLEDADPTVVSAAVNVICELARRNPKSYLPLAPQLYSLLTNSSNNWMLIKIVKLVKARLTKKLVPPITNLIQTTQAMSLLYECIHTVISGGMISSEPAAGKETTQDEAHDSTLARLCVSKLKLFVEDPDQNLKYLGLLALCKLLPLRPRVVAEHKDVVLECLDDKDISIRMRALELLTGMVTKKNLPDIVRRLMIQLLPQAEADTLTQKSFALTTADKNYSKEVIERILNICSCDTYSMVTDFEWYISVLTRLVKVPFVSVGDKISLQLVDICVRVKNVREFALTKWYSTTSRFLLLDSASHEENNANVLYAAAWICSEYSGYIQSKPLVLDALTGPGIMNWPFRSRPYATLKLVESLRKFEASPDIEVQERASSSILLLNYVHSRFMEGGRAAPEVVALTSLFSGELNPVAPTAQKKVPVPEGLDLEHGFESGEESEDFWEKTSTESKLERKQRPIHSTSSQAADDVDSIPIVKLSLDDLPDLNNKPAKKTKKKAKKAADALIEGLPSVRQVSYEINRGFEMPDVVVPDVEHREVLDDLQRRRNAAVDDPDTLAVLSVDFSASAEQKPNFEIGRAAVLSSDLQKQGTNELLVVRKKLDGEVKSPKLKKKSSEKKDKEAGEKSEVKKKKKAREATEEKVKVKKVKAKKGESSKASAKEDVLIDVISPPLAKSELTPVEALLDVDLGPADALDLSSRQLYMNEAFSAMYNLESDIDTEKSLLNTHLTISVLLQAPSQSFSSMGLCLASEPPAFFLEPLNGNLAPTLKLDFPIEGKLARATASICLSLTHAGQALPTLKGVFTYTQVCYSDSETVCFFLTCA
ncbi:adaptin N terminal region-domain-containing protein [Chytridium lagenaria]|nr:adaptin N terminal region-domain-containing protein [Chytridium lagenaria]